MKTSAHPVLARTRVRSRQALLGCVPIVVLIVVLGSGCQRTMLATAPTDQSGCDPSLVGHWSSIGDSEGGGDGKDGELEATVGTDCSVVLVEHRKEGPRSSPPLVLGSTALAGHQLLWVDAGGVNAAFDIESGPVDRDGSVYLYTWTLADDVATLSPPDHAALARHIIDGDIDGAVFTEHRDLVVRLDLDRPELAGLLALPGSFDEGKSMRFRRRQPAQ